MNARASWNNDKRNNINFLAKYFSVAQKMLKTGKQLHVIRDDKCNILQIRNTVPLSNSGHPRQKLLHLKGHNSREKTIIILKSYP